MFSLPDSFGVPEPKKTDLHYFLFSSPVITSYSIHYTKLYDAFDRLHSKLAEVEENVSQSVETGGYKLTLNAIRDFETENLAFLETELGECDLPP